VFAYRIHDERVISEVPKKVRDLAKNWITQCSLIEPKFRIQQTEHHKWGIDCCFTGEDMQSRDRA